MAAKMYAKKPAVKKHSGPKKASTKNAPCPKPKDQKKKVLKKSK